MSTDILKRLTATGLPVLETFPALADAFLKHSLAILQAAPGAGKSTLIPLFLLDQPWMQDKKIIVLEPRRLAARSVAERMASLLGEKTGQRVGYRIRFETKVSAATRIEVVTEGILVRMLQEDNFLEQVNLVIFDEFHERNLHSDLALTLLTEVVQNVRPDLKILLMSATMDVQTVAAWLGTSALIHSEGRQYPVAENYVPFPVEKPLQQAVAELIRKALEETSGDILVFLPGTGDIKRTSALLAARPVPAEVFELYGDLPFDKQQKVLQPSSSGKRKVILSTAIAETSLTIEGVRVVIDSGLARVPRFSPASGLTKLETVPVSQDAADQRKGRAGRLSEGTCYRMWAAAYTSRLPATRKPEISESDLTPLILELARWGNSDPSAYNWLTPPGSAATEYALRLLKRLDAIDSTGKITGHGKHIASFPAHPRIANMLTKGKSSLATDIAAILEEKDFLPADQGADIYFRIMELRNYRAGKFSRYKTSLQKIERSAATWRTKLGIQKTDNSEPVHDDIGRLLLHAYPDRVAQQTDNSLTYRISSGGMAALEREDPLAEEKFMVLANVFSGQKTGRIYLAAALSQNILAENAEERAVLKWDPQKEQLVNASEKAYDQLVLSRRIKHDADPDLLWEILQPVILDKGAVYLEWSEEAQQLQHRVQSMSVWHPEESWPDFSTAALLERSEEWIRPFLPAIKTKEDFKKLNVHDAALTLLSWEQQQDLNRRAPSRIEVPTGSMIALQYSVEGLAPVLAVRLQEVFGMKETPRIDQGRQPVLMHLLSPGHKLVQITADLKSFWKNGYPEVKKELKMRYLKHSWPDDPLTAVPVRGVKRRGN